ncbi:hypothetical protein NSPZN2_50027 [Nitrospira defluvii]|uniref:Uncharacterized protein n=1 Tax=Nitrospira defluvii TaxID=330214 RepID=A0ABN7M511_9BACT|nr:hypothetical protein NSPZN2_50027 [Nitrospira defluvii]
MKPKQAVVVQPLELPVIKDVERSDLTSEHGRFP